VVVVRRSFLIAWEDFPIIAFEDIHFLRISTKKTRYTLSLTRLRHRPGALCNTVSFVSRRETAYLLSDSCSEDPPLLATRYDDGRGQPRAAFTVVAVKE
jgi:hypothetical protein